MNILQLNTSARTSGARSTQLADTITQRLLARHPDATLTVRDVALTPHPVLDEFTLAALQTPPARRTAAQTARVALDDILIAELKFADVLVLGVPMYNFHIPVQLKSWIDAVARAGVTFRYSPTGPEGLLTGKKAYVALTRGGRYQGTDADHQAPYLKNVLGFIGISDVSFVYAEGLSMGDEAANEGLARAETRIYRLFA